MGRRLHPRTSKQNSPRLRKDPFSKLKNLPIKTIGDLLMAKISWKKYPGSRRNPQLQALLLRNDLGHGIKVEPIKLEIEIRI